MPYIMRVLTDNSGDSIYTRQVRQLTAGLLMHVLVRQGAAGQARAEHADLLGRARRGSRWMLVALKMWGASTDKERCESPETACSACLLLLRGKRSNHDSKHGNPESLRQ